MLPQSLPPDRQTLPCHPSACCAHPYSGLAQRSLQLAHLAAFPNLRPSPAPSAFGPCNVYSARRRGPHKRAPATPRSPLPPQCPSLLPPPPPPPPSRRKLRASLHGTACQHGGSAERDPPAAAPRCKTANAGPGARSRSREGGRGAASARQQAGAARGSSLVRWAAEQGNQSLDASPK